MATTLQSIVDQLLENKKATDKTTDSISTVADLLRAQIDENRIIAENNARNQIEASRKSSGRSVVGEVVATGGNAIAGTAGGLIGLGAGIAGFMAALSVGSMGLEWLGSDYSGLEEALQSFSGALVHLTPTSVLALGAVTTAAIGAGIFRVNGLTIAGNMAGLGVGIASFMGALALGDIGISWINAIPAGSSKGLVSAFEMFNEIVVALDLKSITTLGALITASAAFGTVGAAGVMAGMTAIGIGISSFMAALALGEAGISWIGAIPEGSSKGLLSTFQLFNNLVLALDPKAMAAMAVLMTAGTALGATGVGAAGIAVGMTAIGAGIAGFMGAIAAADGITALINMATSGTPGEALRHLFTNIFTGVASASQLKGINLIDLGAGLTAVAGGLAAFGVGSIINGLGQAVSSIVSFFAGESAFDQIMKLADKAPGLTAAGQALEVIATALGKFGEIRFDASNVDFEAMALQLGKAIPTLKALAIGGEVEGSGVWGIGKVIFPEGGILNPNLKLDEMADAIGKVNYILGRTTTPINAQAMPSTSGADLTAANNATQSMIYNAPVYNYITNNHGGGGTSIMTVPVPTVDYHDRRDGIRYGR